MLPETLGPRIERMRRRFIETTPELVADRARLVTESYRQTLGRPYVIRRAKAFERVMREADIQIFEDELTVGSFSGLYRGCQLYPEYDLGFVIDELDTIQQRNTERFVVAEETKAELREIYDHWQGNSLASTALDIIPPDARASSQDGIFLLTVLRGGVGHIIIDYPTLITRGLRFFLDKIEALRAALDPHDPQYASRTIYYQAAEICGRAFIAWANRYADLADDLAGRASGRRKKELETMAAICRKVPERPAETFQEALQAFWFLHLAIHYESSGHSISPGRFDQYMYPFYKKDIEGGLITEEWAEEMLQSLWLKFNEVNKIRDQMSSVAYSGGSMFQNLNVGGLDRHGRSAVNGLSRLCVKTTTVLRLPQPSLSVRWFYGIEKDFMDLVMDLVAAGTGHPAIFNDECLIPNMLLMGYDLQEARNYGIVGCTEFVGQGIAEPWLTAGFINALKMIELTIFDGYDPMTGQQRPFRTGPVEKMAGFQDFYEAYLRQFDYYLGQQITCNNILETLHAEFAPVPFEALFIDGCLEAAQGNFAGGARHNSATLEVVGGPNAIDALAAIDTLIYRERKFSWAELKEALLKDFQGYEHIRGHLLNHVPKYGNDDEYVDEIGRGFIDRLYRLVDKYRTTRNSKYRMAIYSVSSHILFAPRTGATPDGRRKGDLIADGGISCAQGRDKEGPTGLLNTIVKMDPAKILGSALLNIKLSPELLKPAGRPRVLELLEAYFLNKGQHIQFNVVDVETLRAAQQHPDQHPSLMVRVAGFSVFFNSISKEVQDDIINRTVHNSGSLTS